MNTVNQAQIKKITTICRLIEESDQEFNLEELASHAGLSTFHFHRLFKSVTGVTPKAYAAAHRAKRIQTHLTKKKNITDAILDAGYNSHGRFYENSDKMLGMTPSSYRDGGKNTEIRFAIGECSLGAILVAMSQRGVCAIYLDDDPEVLIRYLQDKFPKANLIGGDKSFEKTIAKVVGFVETPAIGFDLPLDIRGTAFQQRVWQALTEIPVGTTVTYADIAKKIGLPKAVRAVANACGANPIAVAIPCHRVIRSDGSLSGYNWGVKRKAMLLKKEKQ